MKDLTKAFCGNSREWWMCFKISDEDALSWYGMIWFFQLILNVINYPYFSFAHHYWGYIMMLSCFSSFSINGYIPSITNFQNRSFKWCTIIKTSVKLRTTQTVLITLSKDLAQFWNVFDIVVILSMSGNTEDKKQ